MKAIKLLIFCFIMYSFLSFVFADTTSIYADSFNILISYTTLGYSYTTQDANIPNKPITSQFGSYGFGINGSDRFTTVQDKCHSICANFSNYISSGGIQVFFDFNVYYNTTAYSTPLYLKISNRSCTGGTEIIGINIYNSSFTMFSDLTGFEACSGNLTPNYNYSNNYISYSLDGKVYNVFINNSLVCENKVLTTSSALISKAISIGSCFAKVPIMVSIIDNINVYTDSSNLTVVSVGMPCTDNLGCVTDNCVLGYCQYKSSLQACSYNYECLSGQCINNICTKSSLFQAIDSTKDSLFGTDKESSNLICMIFIAISVAALLIIGGIAGSIKAGMYLAVVAVYLESFFFAIIGWLSFFIVFSLVLVAVIFIIATIFIMNRMGNG